MVKDREVVIEYVTWPTLTWHQADYGVSTSEFNDLVNMTPNELRNWLEEDQSVSSGWTNESGETIGHER